MEILDSGLADGLVKMRRAFDAVVARCLELEAALKAKDEEIARLRGENLSLERFAHLYIKRPLP